MERVITIKASPGYDLVRLAENGEIAERVKRVEIHSAANLFEWVEMPEARAAAFCNT